MPEQDPTLQEARNEDYKKFIGDARRYLIDIARNPSPDVTRKDRKFFRLYRRAVKQAKQYHDDSFLKAWETASAIYNRISRRKVRSASNIEKLGEESRVALDEILEIGLTPNEIFDGQIDHRDRKDGSFQKSKASGERDTPYHALQHVDD